MRTKEQYSEDRGKILEYFNEYDIINTSITRNLLNVHYFTAQRILKKMTYEEGILREKTIFINKYTFTYYEIDEKNKIDGFVGEKNVAKI